MTYISRIIRLKGWHSVLYGRDLGDVLDDGIVYGVQKIMDVITLVPIGEAVTPHFGWKLANIIRSGRHCLTKEEYRAILIEDGFLSKKEIEQYVNGTSSSDGI